MPVPKEVTDLIEEHKSSVEKQKEIYDNEIGEMKKQMEDMRKDDRRRQEAAEEELRELRARGEEMAVELSKAKATNLPVVQDPPGIAFDKLLLETWTFLKEIRLLSQTAFNVISDMSTPAPSKEYDALVNTMELLNKLLDLRLTACRAATMMRTNKKLEFVGEYTAELHTKVFKTEGKWATGEKSVAEVQSDVARSISDRLMRMPDNSSAGAQFQRGGGRGGNRGGAGGYGGGGVEFAGMGGGYGAQYGAQYGAAPYAPARGFGRGGGRGGGRG